MQAEEQQLIEGLFSRLKEAEGQAAPRDPAAEQAIEGHLARQPAAPYYMAQVILIQEAALKRLDQRMRELEMQVEQLQRSRPQQSSGGFLAGLFGAGARDQPAAPGATGTGWRETGRTGPGGGWNMPGSRSGAGMGASGYASGPGRGGSFLGGALQTAAGVAGGMVLGNLLMDMFDGSHPEEIVNVINETPTTDDVNQDFGDPGFDQRDQYADYEGDAGNGLQDDGGFFDGGDDDSFV